MRVEPYKIVEHWLKRLFQLGREVTQTSLVLGMVLVLLLCLLTTPFRSALTESAAKHFYDKPAIGWTRLSSADGTALPAAARQAKAPNGRVGVGAAFKGPVGLQLYSLRNEFKRDGVPATLQRVRAMGFREVEAGNFYGLTAKQFRAQLDKAGLKAVSLHVGFDDLRIKLNDIVSDAKTLGAEYVANGWIPHQRPFSPDVARQAVLVFNQAGAVLKAAGLKFCYHPHGYEFQPHGEGTLFDLMLQQTKPELVNFELDVFWAIHAGQDPAKLLQTHPKRFTLVHLKDLRKDVAGDLTGSAPDDTSVVLGTGKVDWAAVLRAARQAGVKWYFIEAEEPEAAAHIPLSLRFLERIRF